MAVTSATGRRLAALLAPLSLYALIGFVLVWPSLSWPMAYDDLHLVRAYTPQELAGVWYGPWDPDRIETTSFRPLTTLFNHCRYRVFGESARGHRAFLVLSYAVFLALLVPVVADFTPSRWAAVVAGLLCLCSKYSVFHYVWIADGVHQPPGFAFLAALSLLLGFLSRGPSAARLACLAGSLLSILGGLLVREDTIAIVPVLWLLGWTRTRRPEGPPAAALGRYVVSSSLLVSAYLLLRQLAVPEAVRPRLHIRDYSISFLRAFLITGDDRTDALVGLMVSGWIVALGVILAAVVWCARRGEPIGHAAVWLLAAGLSALPSLTVGRANLLFFPVTFAALCLASAIDVWRRQPGMAVLVPAVVAAVTLSGGYTSRVFAQSFHPRSTTFLEWNAWFAFEVAAWATIPPGRLQEARRHLQQMGVGDATHWDDLTRLKSTAAAAGHRSPAAAGAFVPRLVRVW
jgi:hypothetical protein